MSCLIDSLIFEDENLLISKSLLKRQPSGCEYQSVFRRGVRRHQGAIQLGIKHACDERQKEYGDRNNLKVHKKSVHEGVFYQCDQLNKTYSNHKGTTRVLIEIVFSVENLLKLQWHCIIMLKNNMVVLNNFRI